MRRKFDNFKQNMPQVLIQIRWKAMLLVAFVVMLNAHAAQLLGLPDPKP
jgi:hypothetical protein